MIGMLIVFYRGENWPFGIFGDWSLMSERGGGGGGAGAF